MSTSVRGLGLLSPLGDSPEAFAERLFAGQVAPGPSAAHPGALTAEIAGFKPRSYLQQKGLQVLSRAALLAAAALALLRKRAAPLLDPSAERPADRIGLVVGTAFGHLESKTCYSQEAAREGVALVSPILFPNTIINSLGGHAAILNGWRGPNSTVVAGARSSLEAVSYAEELLRTGRADRVAVAGCDEVSRPLLDGLGALGLLSAADPRGADASRPFAPGQGGIYPAEAACAVVLEPGDSARVSPSAPPGAPPVLGIILGSGSASSVRRGVEGAARRAFELALGTAGLAAAGIGWIALSGSGRAQLDAAEARAVSAVFGPAVAAAAIKRQCGETFGAGGLLALASALLSLARREVPPTPGAAAAGDFLAGLRPVARPFTGPRAVLVSAVDEDGASALVVGGPSASGG